jgi:transitional endoplasmic reticulum ATPase
MTATASHPRRESSSATAIRHADQTASATPAVANESHANFISIKGPEIMSKWVGESEKAVRQAFKKAKQVAPAVVFLDEIDAIAPRGSAGHKRHRRVVNQLLTSWTGNLKVTVIAATNRPDIIDPALRPGRFDRLVLIPIPDEKARLAILSVHTKAMPIRNVDVTILADKTEGFVGADLENLCREAAMIALREDKDAEIVEMRHFELALKMSSPLWTRTS